MNRVKCLCFNKGLLTNREKNLLFVPPSIVYEILDLFIFDLYFQTFCFIYQRSMKTEHLFTCKGKESHEISYYKKILKYHKSYKHYYSHSLVLWVILLNPLPPGTSNVHYRFVLWIFFTHADPQVLYHHGSQFQRPKYPQLIFPFLEF